MKPVLDIAEFCAEHGISRTLLHTLEKEGKAPRMMKVGRRRLITQEAAAEWRAKMEEQTAQGADQ